MSNVKTIKKRLPVLGSRLRVLKTSACENHRLSGGRWQVVRQQVLLRDSYACVICGYTSMRNEVDHIIPIAQGGSNDYSNLQTLCHACHVSKTTREQKERLENR